MARKQRYPKTEGDTPFIRSLRPQNANQEFYLKMINEMAVTFCSGPAGTGKTFLAAYIALTSLLDKQIDKIILTRPIVAVEDIGYLPGDMNEKIHPYILPLLDAVEAHIGPTKTRDLLDDGRLEVLPLAYMRGRSLNRAFLLLDEAQNTTKEQMKMFLTRLGYDSKIVVNGDASQSDLPKGVDNGLIWALDRLNGRIPTVGVHSFASKDIVRNPLIKDMLQFLD